MDYAELLEQVERYTGLTSGDQAERALTATTAAVASCLPAPDRELWAKRLPHELRALWAAATFRSGQSAEAVYAQVPAIERVPAPYAREHAQAVVRLLAGPLDPADRELLARHLPDELGALVRDPRLVEGVIARGYAPHSNSEPSGRTLATGAAGSRHPVSTASPRSGHSGSIADWDPHRMDHSLATAQDDGSPDNLAGHKDKG